MSEVLTKLNLETQSMSIEDLKKERLILKTILKKLTREISSTEEECQLICELIIRKKFKNISESKPVQSKEFKKAIKSVQ